MTWKAVVVLLALTKIGVCFVEPSCNYWGQVHGHGDSWQDTVLRVSCRCDNGRALCEKCRSPMCYNPVTVIGRTCQICPNGRNCLLQNSVVSPFAWHMDKMVYGHKCRCFYVGNKVVEDCREILP